MPPSSTAIAAAKVLCAGALAILLAGCGDSIRVGCGIGTASHETGPGVYSGPGPTNPIARVQGGEPLVCRVRIPF